MATFAEIKTDADNAKEVRKVLEAVAFLLPMTVDLPDTIFGPDKQLVALPEGAVPIGMVTRDGYKFTTEVEKADVDAFGYSDPVRTDYIRAPRQIEFTMLQSLRKELVQFTNAVDLAGVVTGANGEIVFDEAPIPQPMEQRLLLIGKDGFAATEILQGRGYGRVKLAEIPEQAWASEDPQQFPCTLDVLLDTDLGTPVRHYIGGKGFDATAYGYTAA